MKLNKNLLLVFILLVVVAALFRVIPDRPLGFAPHWAMALFGGAIIRDKKWAFALPVFSLFLSDLLYHFLYTNGLAGTPGFYHGQWVNYVLFVAVTCLGFFMRNLRVGTLISFFFLAPTVFFLFSNFAVWIGRGGYQRPMTFEGLMQCYGDGLPFYKGAILATFVFGTVLFGLYVLANKRELAKENI